MRAAVVRISLHRQAAVVVHRDLHSVACVIKEPLVPSPSPQRHHDIFWGPANSRFLHKPPHIKRTSSLHISSKLDFALVDAVRVRDPQNFNPSNGKKKLNELVLDLSIVNIALSREHSQLIGDGTGPAKAYIQNPIRKTLCENHKSLCQQ